MDIKCRNFETLLFSVVNPIEPWTKQDSILLSKLVGFFMTYDYQQELQRSYIDAIFKDQTDLKDFAELFLTTEDREWSWTILDDDDLKKMNMFEKDAQVYDPTKRDKNLYADLSDLVNQKDGQSSEGVDDFAAMQQEFTGGSNAWVI